MGRRLTQDYPTLGYVQFPSAVTGLEYDAGTRVLTLTNNNTTQLTTEINPPADVFLNSGYWDASGDIGVAVPIRGVNCAFTDMTMVPGIPLVGRWNILAASSGFYIPLLGGGEMWSSFTVPNTSGGDNLQSYGIAFLNSQASYDDLAAVVNEGVPGYEASGAVLAVDTSGITYYVFGRGYIQNTGRFNFDSTAIPGDKVYVSLRQNSDVITAHRDGESSALEFSFGGIHPQGEDSLCITAFATFGSDVATVSDTLTFNLGDSTIGDPMRAHGSATVPIGAVVGNEFIISQYGVFSGRVLRSGRIVKFISNMMDVIVTSDSVVESISPAVAVPGVLSLEYSQNSSLLTLTRALPDGSTDTLTATIDTTKSSGIAIITDITPTYGSGNVSGKVYSNGGYVLDSCVSGTTEVDVHVLATTGTQNFRPTVTLNGNPVTLTAAESRGLWQGVLSMSLPSYTSTITVSHAEGLSHSCVFNYQMAPTVLTAIFQDSYPNVGQVEYAAGASVDVVVTADVPFTAIEFQDSVGSATTANSASFAPTTSKRVTVQIADRGDTRQSKQAIVRVQDANGTWSSWYSSGSAGSTDHVNVVYLNNVRPHIAFDPASYPPGQQAIKDSEYATLSFSYSDVDSVVWSSPNGQVSFSAPTSLVAQAVYIGSAGVYNDSVNNVRASAVRTANATSAYYDTLVCIADVLPRVTVSVPAARLRSGGTHGSAVQSYTITLSSNQKLITIMGLDAGIGTWDGIWSSSDGGYTWTRPLLISDADSKGATSFSSLAAVTLAGTTQTSIYSGSSYTVGGFVLRTVSVSAWPNREADIGTYVTNTSKLRATNLSKGSSGSHNTTFGSSTTNLTDSYTITGPTGTYNPDGRVIYNRDLSNAVSNTTGLLQYEIEELV